MDYRIKCFYEYNYIKDIISKLDDIILNTLFYKYIDS